MKHYIYAAFFACVSGFMAAQVLGFLPEAFTNINLMLIGFTTYYLVSNHRVLLNRKTPIFNPFKHIKSVHRPVNIFDSNGDSGRIIRHAEPKPVTLDGILDLDWERPKTHRECLERTAVSEHELKWEHSSKAIADACVRCRDERRLRQEADMYRLIEQSKREKAKREAEEKKAYAKAKSLDLLKHGYTTPDELRARGLLSVNEAREQRKWQQVIDGGDYVIIRAADGTIVDVIPENDDQHVVYEHALKALRDYNGRQIDTSTPAPIVLPAGVDVTVFGSDHQHTMFRRRYEETKSQLEKNLAMIKGLEGKIMTTQAELRKLQDSQTDSVVTYGDNIKYLNLKSSEKPHVETYHRSGRNDCECGDCMEKKEERFWGIP